MKLSVVTLIRPSVRPKNRPKGSIGPSLTYEGTLRPGLTCTHIIVRMHRTLINSICRLSSRSIPEPLFPEPLRSGTALTAFPYTV